MEGGGGGRGGGGDGRDRVALLRCAVRGMRFEIILELCEIDQVDDFHRLWQ